MLYVASEAAGLLGLYAPTLTTPLAGGCELVWINGLDAIGREIERAINGYD